MRSVPGRIERPAGSGTLAPVLGCRCRRTTWCRCWRGPTECGTGGRDAHFRRGVALVARTQRTGLRKVFLEWLDQLAAQIGVDLSIMEVKGMREDLEADGEVRLMVEERLQASLDKMKAQSYQEGLELGRQEVREEKLDLLRRLTARRFGADTARRLDPLLVGIKDPERLSSVFDWLVDCTTGPELLARLRHSD